MAIRRHKQKSGKMSYYVVVHDARTEKRVYGGVYERLADAKAAERALVERVKSTRPVLPQMMSLREFTPEWLKTKQLRAESAAAYGFDIRWINDTLGDKRLADISSQDIELFAAALAGKLATLTRRRILARLLQILDKAEAWGYIDRVPNVKIKELVKGGRERQPRIFTREELKAVVKAAPEQYKAAFAIWPLTGLRLREMHGLKVDDLDFGAGVIHVRRQVQRQQDKPCKGAPRDVAMPPIVAVMLQEHIDKFAPRDYLFTSPNSMLPLSDGTWRSKVWLPTVDAAGIGPFRSHDFRHTFGAILVEQGASVQYIQRQMGHASASTTLNEYNDLLNKEDYSFSAKMDAWYAGQISDKAGL